MADRDFISAARERVVIFDGGMGATLEQFDLTQEDYGGLQGKCHEALVLNRPDVSDTSFVCVFFFFSCVCVCVFICPLLVQLRIARSPPLSHRWLCLRGYLHAP